MSTAKIREALTRMLLLAEDREANDGDRSLYHEAMAELEVSPATSDDVERAARLAWNAALEEAAKVVVSANQRKRGTFDIARDVRALKREAK